MTERERFKASHKHLDLSETKDAWDRPIFAHSHVEAMWSGWKRALESRVLAERTEPVAWAVPQEMAGASFITCCVQGGAYTVPLFTHPTPDDAGEIDRLQKIAWLIASIFAHGDFKAETYNERALEKLLRENGTFFTSPQEYDAAIDAAMQADKEPK